MKRTRFFGLLFFFVFGNSPVFGLESNQIVGNYELVGVMEMAGMLMLKEGQKYSAGFSYGAADWLEEGTWQVEGEEVVLKEGRFKVKNYPDLPLFLPAGTRFKYQDGKLTGADPARKLVFLNPNKTQIPSQKSAAQCVPVTESSLKLMDGNLLSVEKDQVVIADIGTRRDVVVSRSWAEKNIPDLLNPPKLFKSVRNEIPKSAITCVKPIVSGEGRMRVRGRVVKLDSDSLTVEMGECLDFNVNSLSDAVLKAAKEKKGEAIDVEIPYSAMISAGGCP